ncbi:hypothetical protein SARC_02680 [Sphaeroforma arctica JP610]|uniref:Uncharacterized protein n=1 Tax=Sphaeroforma arctica JP610 TaxID=667725 RepID=A0A0L0G813_9EUKA|nr:hypothetical protein SARC_02680 [Sphaeroforma arctica JP610]KNC85125.1 hypothetical protein SARC_02680 [Sphaeroforma arctica JP610]|eukprot:XP_014159027.1 hypothetical protein SARC_02680 [Sphaeroforma arctica JP610]
MDSDPNLDLDLDLELTPDDVPTPDAIGLCLQLCEEEITKERCLPINVVVADVRRYVRDPLVKKAVTAQFDDDNADMFDVVFCEPESDPNIWMKAVLPPSAYEDVYKARIRTGTLIRIDRVKLYLKQHKNSTAASNVIIIQDMRVLRQDCDVGLDEDRMDEPTRTRLYTPLLETRLYYIAMHNSTDVLARDPKWKSELDVERPKTIQVSNLDDILQNGVKKKLTIYGRVVAKQRLMQHATMDAKHLAPIRGSFTIAGISSSSNAEGSTSTKMRVVLWDVAAMKHYNGVQLGSVVSIDGYRLKPFWSASKNEDEDDLCGMEVSVNSSTPTGHVRVVAPNPASKNITKFLKRFPTQKYHFGWPRDTPRPIYANCDLIGVLLYVGRPLVTVSRDTHNVLKPSQIQMRENKIFEYKDTVDGIDPPAPQDDGLQSINRTTNGSTAHTADGTTEGTSTRTPAGDGPVHLSEGIERLNESDEIGSQSSESDYDSEAERVVPVGTKNNQSVRDGEGGGGGIDRHTHTHSKTTQNKDSAETRDGTGVQPGGAETDGCKRLRRSSRQLNWNENEDVKQISPNGRRRNRSEGESPHRSTHTGINIRKRTKQADHHSHKDGHSKHAQQAPDLADIFTTREGRAVRRWAETDAAKQYVGPYSAVAARVF